MSAAFREGMYDLLTSVEIDTGKGRRVMPSGAIDE